MEDTFLPSFFNNGGPPYNSGAREDPTFGSTGPTFNGAGPTFNAGPTNVLSIPSIQVESLTLPDLMKNPHVQAMYNSWKEASAQVIQGAQMQHSLFKENNRLTAEVSALHERYREDL